LHLKIVTRSTSYLDKPNQINILGLPGFLAVILDSSLNGTHNNPNQIQMPIQWVRFPAAGSQASSVVADREREDQILDLQALSRLLASFRESLDPIRRIRVYSVRFRLIGSPNYLPSIHSTFQWRSLLAENTSTRVRILGLPFFIRPDLFNCVSKAEPKASEPLLPGPFGQSFSYGSQSEP